MPSPEGEKRRQKGRDVPEQPNNPEREPKPYLKVARFSSELPAEQAYFQAQEALYTGPPNDLSVYRLQFEQISHVAVLGEEPPEELEQQLTAILAAGEPTTLPQDVLEFLRERREQAKQLGPWVEGHYRPGKPVRTKRRRK